MNQNNCFRVTRIAIHLLLQQKKFNYGQKFFFRSTWNFNFDGIFREAFIPEKQFCLFGLFFGKLDVYLHPKIFSSYGSKLLFPFRFKKIELPLREDSPLVVLLTNCYRVNVGSPLYLVSAHFFDSTEAVLLHWTIGGKKDWHVPLANADRPIKNAF